MKYTTKQLEEYLDYQDYPKDNTLRGSVISQLENLCPEAQSLLDQWIKNQKMPKIDIEGITTDFLLSKHKMTPFAVILTYDKIIKNPKEATWLLRRTLIKHK